MDLDSPVLRHAFLSDVHPRHQFEAREHRVLHALGEVVTLGTDAVNSVPEPHTVFHGLDVNIARPVSDGFVEDSIHQLDDRGILAAHINRAVH